MVTTIAVRESTAQVLTRLKEEMNAGSIDEAITLLLEKARSVPKTRFGAQPKLRRLKEEERAHFHEL